ncbi:phosphate ABC transporter permease PstA [Halorussus sp. AFM4]|uniref:phosphate ABC transporter permease PstA n=1 Tax=Halorussus sp. AFM4 TaxID=3421651 RepID=UPI003EBE5FEB
MATENVTEIENQRVSRWKGKLFVALSFGATIIGIVTLGILLTYVAVDAIGWLDWQFLTSATSRFPEEAGIYPALVGSVFLILLIAFISFPVGVGAAIYLEEYAPDTRLVRAIQVNISNLAGVPSVVYGILGLALFIQLLNIEYGTLIVAALTVSLLILPIVIISAQEAIRSVPDSLRQASYGMGATKWQTIRNVVLPRALPGILTGTILALGRAIGETAPLVMIGVPATIYSVPSSLTSKFTAMPMQIFAWVDLPSDAFQHGVMAAGVITLLVVLLTMNSIAILIRNKYQKQS